MNKLVTRAKVLETIVSQEQENTFIYIKTARSFGDRAVLILQPHCVYTSVNAIRFLPLFKTL
ncbi:hypothetical protein MKY19_17785 [Paenibacillus sp. FSL R5-0744]|uniref:hypothetical protein n=1 Tax=Paenibacillus TaxID=44249 RepID=UPI00117C1B10|nr:MULTISPECIES: hypothetical protein [Paenibacillus]KAA1178376.1 hypothetical protein PAENI_30040 [Paenibacillus sp. B2(2019)]